MLGHERCAQQVSGRDAVGSLLQNRPKLFDRAIDVAHAVERLSEALPGFDHFGLEAKCLAQEYRGGRHVAPEDRRPAEPELSSCLGFTRVGRLGGWRCVSLSCARACADCARRSGGR